MFFEIKEDAWRKLVVITSLAQSFYNKHHTALIRNFIFQFQNGTQERSTDHSFARISPTKSYARQSGQWQPIKGGLHHKSYMLLTKLSAIHTSKLIVHYINTSQSDDILQSKVANASAWTRRNDVSSGIEGLDHSSGPSGTAHNGSMTATDLWTLGANELVASQARERERRLDVGKCCACSAIIQDNHLVPVTICLRFSSHFTLL